jgi:hypothetical protein
MSNIRAWRSLLRIKERRTAQQEEAVQAARAELANCEAALQQAQQTQAARANEWEQARQRVRDLLDGEDAFKPGLLIARRHQVDEREQTFRKAEGETERHQQRVRGAMQDLDAAKAQLQRMEHQLGLAREALEKALRAQEQAQEDQQDEDSEETAVARMLAASRAVQEGATHGTRV